MESEVRPHMLMDDDDLEDSDAEEVTDAEEEPRVADMVEQPRIAEEQPADILCRC